MSELLERFKQMIQPRDPRSLQGSPITLTQDEAEAFAAAWGAAEEIAGTNPLTIGPDGPDHVVIGVRKVEWIAERLTNEKARAAAVRLGALSERT
jgi:hypothetical protein